MGSNTLSLGKESFSDSKKTYLTTWGSNILSLGKESKYLSLKQILLGEAKTWLWGRKDFKQKILNFQTKRTTSFQNVQACCFQGFKVSFFNHEK
jgi:hypothetical protein